MAKQSSRNLSRRQARDLDVEISFLEGLVRRDPAYVEALQLLGDNYADRGRPAEGLCVDERLRQLRPDDANVRFNYACSLALNRLFERACEELDCALDLGYRDFKWLQRDPDLAELRKHPSFKKIKARIKALQTIETAED
jgi:tetratricopeptide (TPR) repeat protein